MRSCSIHAILSSPIYPFVEILVSSILLEQEPKVPEGWTFKVTTVRPVLYGIIFSTKKMFSRCATQGSSVQCQAHLLRETERRSWKQGDRAEQKPLRTRQYSTRCLPSHVNHTVLECSALSTTVVQGHHSSEKLR